MFYESDRTLWELLKRLFGWQDKTTIYKYSTKEKESVSDELITDKHNYKRRFTYERIYNLQKRKCQIHDEAAWTA